MSILLLSRSSISLKCRHKMLGKRNLPQRFRYLHQINKRSPCHPQEKQISAQIRGKKPPTTKQTQSILQFSALNRPENIPKNNQPNLPSKAGLYFSHMRTKLLLSQPQYQTNPQPAFTPHLYMGWSYDLWPTKGWKAPSQRRFLSPFPNFPTSHSQMKNI